jgi:hypothetical protein
MSPLYVPTVDSVRMHLFKVLCALTLLENRKEKTRAARGNNGTTSSQSMKRTSTPQDTKQPLF